MKLIILALMLALLGSCSFKKNQTSVEETEAGVELSDSDELVDEELAEGDIIDENTEEIVSEDEAAAENTEEIVAEDSADAMEETNSVASSDPEVVIEESAGVQEYTVQKNETLMMVAFKLYGDYGKWKEIANMNQATLSGGQHVSAGTVLKYNAPKEAFTWSPEGTPYLIKTGDTLGSISTDAYGTMKFWKNIWDNNKPLIKDPNKIYAGFTIYNPVIEGRDVAAN